jgi:hypothetical protein
MTSRRILEFWESNHSIEFRQRLITDTPPRADSAVLIIRVADAGDYTLDGYDVEELHAWTFEILAGRKQDPRIEDARIMCGAEAHSPADGHLECALYDGHGRIAGSWGHITAEGLVFDSDVPF